MVRLLPSTRSAIMGAWDGSTSRPRPGRPRRPARSTPCWSTDRLADVERARRGRAIEPGEGDGDGVGAASHPGGVAGSGRGRVVELVPDRRLGYVPLAGVPLRDYRANVDLPPRAAWTAIRWYADSPPRFPGTGAVVRMGAGRFLATATTAPAARAPGRPPPAVRPEAGSGPRPMQAPARTGHTGAAGGEADDADRQEGELGG